MISVAKTADQGATRGDYSAAGGDCPRAAASERGAFLGARAPVAAASLADLLLRYDRPAPRYTSYPPANHFHSGVGAKEYAAALAGLPAGEPLSLYVHIPFCAHRCTYCGCHVVPTRNENIGARYLESVLAEARLVRERLAPDVRATALHLGGGTPTFLRPVQLDALLGVLGRIFAMDPLAEIAVELDPRVTTEEHLDVLRSRGVQRVSLGVQDTSFDVQVAIGRFQSREVTRSFFELCRRKGFTSINIDLVHGLPLQTLARFERTLDDVIEMRPERLAVFGYAHVPWVRPHQKAIRPEDLPSGEARMALSLKAHEKLGGAGYVHIGLDHFAWPGDELAMAQAERRLGRTFMGYTPHRGLKGIGLGVSAIGDLGPGYFQAHKKLADYFASVEAGRLPIERGYLLEREDEIRRHVIQEILCNLGLSYQSFTRHHHRLFGEVFRRELEALRPFESDGLVQLRAEALQVTDVGRLFLRCVAAVFDAHLAATMQQGPVYSRTV